MTIGPQVRLITHAGIVFQGQATLSFGADIAWENLDATIDSRKADSSTIKPIRPFLNPHRPSFDLEPEEISIVHHFKPQFNFGIDLTVVRQELSVGIGADVGYDHSFKFGAGSTRREPIQNCSDGLQYAFELKAELDALVTLPSKRAFFTSHIPAGFLPPRTVFPLLVMKPFVLLQHCFKMPSFATTKKASQPRLQRSNALTSRRITSDEL